MTIKGSLQMSIPIVKEDFLTWNFQSRLKLAKNLRLWGKMGSKCFRDSQKAQKAYWHIDCENRCRGLGWRKNQKTYCTFHIFGTGRMG